MALTEDEIDEKYAKHCGQCNRNMLLAYEHEFISLSCGYCVIKRKNELNKKQKKINFINRLKNAEQKIFGICIEVRKIYESDDLDKIFESFSTLKNKKLKTNNILIEKYKDMNENSDSEQDYWSRTARGIFKIADVSIRKMK